MKFLVNLLIIGACVCGWNSIAEDGHGLLRPVPSNPPDVVDDGDKSRLSCSEIVPALEEYHSLARSNEEALAGFIVEVTNVMFDWHENLRPLEGSSQPIPVGTFDPIYEGAGQIEEVVGLIYENSDQLAARMEVILQSVKDCL